MTSTVLNMILFKVLDIQDDEITQRKIKRQKTDINGRQNIYKIYNLISRIFYNTDSFRTITFIKAISLKIFCIRFYLQLLSFL